MSDWTSRGLPVTSTTSASRPWRAKMPASLAIQGTTKDSVGATKATFTFRDAGAAAAAGVAGALAAAGGPDAAGEPAAAAGRSGARAPGWQPAASTTSTQAATATTDRIVRSPFVRQPGPRPARRGRMLRPPRPGCQPAAPMLGADRGRFEPPPRRAYLLVVPTVSAWAPREPARQQGRARCRAARAHWGVASRQVGWVVQRRASPAR